MCDLVILEFSLHTATWLVYFANQAYYDLPKGIATASSAGTCDLVSIFGFEVVKVIAHEDKDVYCLIARKDNIVVITFRGTASLKNALTDLQMTRVNAGAYADALEEEEEPATITPALTNEEKLNETTESRRARIRAKYGRTASSPQPKKRVPASKSRRERAAIAKSLMQEDYSRVVKIHKGFWVSYAAVRSEVMSVLLKLKHQQVRFRKPDLEVYTTGHSLGGALATLCACTCVRTRA